MKIVLGFIVGLLWGGVASAINTVVGNICAKKNTPEALTAYSYISNIVGLLAVLIIFLLRNVIPLNGLAMIMGTAVSLSTLGILFALRVSGRKKK